MSNTALSILLVGASGRMGEEVCQAAIRSESGRRSVRIVGGLVGDGSPSLGKSVSGIMHPLQSTWISGFAAAEVIIDFSSELGTKQALQIAKAQSLPILVATTGLSQENRDLVKEVAKSVPVLLSANTSIVVTAMLKLVREATKLLGDGFDVEVTELHHNRKKDAPSGTALMLLEEVAAVRGEDSESIIEAGRFGREAVRREGTLGVQSIRGGDAAGEHTIFFLGQGERLEITQRATNRRVFADGALRAAFWLKEQQIRQKVGLFGMEQVLD